MAKKCYWPIFSVVLPANANDSGRAGAIFTIDAKVWNATGGNVKNFLICCEGEPKQFDNAIACKNIQNELNKNPENPDTNAFIGDSLTRHFWYIINNEIVPLDLPPIPRGRKLGQPVRIAISSITFKDVSPEAQAKYCSVCDTVPALRQEWYNLFCDTPTEPSDPTPPTDPDHPVVTKPVPEPQPTQPAIPEAESRKITILNITHGDPCLTSAQSGSKTSILSTSQPVKPLIKSLSNISDLNDIKKRIWKHLTENYDFYYKQIFTESNQFKFTKEQLEYFSKNIVIAEKKTYSFPNNQLIKTEKIKVDNEKYIKRGWVEERPKKNRFSNFGLYINYGLDTERTFDSLRINSGGIGNNLVDPSQFKGVIKDALNSDMVLPTEDPKEKSFFNITFYDTAILKIPIEFVIKAKPKLTGNIKLSLVCEDKQHNPLNGPDPCDTGVIKQHKINLDKMTISETTIVITSNLQILYKIWDGEENYDRINDTEYSKLRFPAKYKRKDCLFCKGSGKYPVDTDKDCGYCVPPELEKKQEIRPIRFNSHANLVNTKTAGLIIFNDTANDQIVEEIKNLFIPSPGGSWPSIPGSNLPIVFNPKIITREGGSTSSLQKILVINGEDSNIPDIFIKSIHPNLLVPNNTTIEAYIASKYSGFIVQDENNKNLRPNNKIWVITDRSALFHSDMTDKDPTEAGPPGKTTQKQLDDMLTFKPAGTIPFNIKPETPKGSTSSTKYFTEILSKEIIDEIKNLLEFNVKENEIDKKPCCCCYWTLDENQDEIKYTLDIEKT